MRNLAPISEEALRRYVDQRTVLRGISWRDFETFVAMRGDCAGPRLAYLDGELELMSPSEAHENLKTTWARLLEAWADEREVELEGRGNWTLKSSPALKGGIEPEECYFVGERGSRTAPDLALEVVWTHSALDKLEIYRRLRVREVWMWEAGEIHIHVLGRRGYSRRASSRLLPELDLELIRRCLEEPSQSKAVKKLRASLRSRRSRS